MSKTFGDQLRKLRGERPQGELAKLFGVSQNAYSSWELGRTEPSLETLARMRGFFNVSLDELCGHSAPQRSAYLQNGLKTKAVEIKKHIFSVSQKADDLLKSIEELEEALASPPAPQTPPIKTPPPVRRRPIK